MNFRYSGVESFIGFGKNIIIYYTKNKHTGLYNMTGFKT